MKEDRRKGFISSHDNCPISSHGQKEVHDVWRHISVDKRLICVSWDRRSSSVHVHLDWRPYPFSFDRSNGGESSLIKWCNVQYTDDSLSTHCMPRSMLLDLSNAWNDLDLLSMLVHHRLIHFSLTLFTSVDSFVHWRLSGSRGDFLLALSNGKYDIGLGIWPKGFLYPTSHTTLVVQREHHSQPLSSER